MLIGMNLEWATYFQADQKFTNLMDAANVLPAPGRTCIPAKEGYCRPGDYILTAAGTGVLNLRDDDLPGGSLSCPFTGAGEKYTVTFKSPRNRSLLDMVSQDAANPIRDIKLYPAELDPAAGTCHPDWLKTLKGVDTLRSVHFVDVDNGSQDARSWANDEKLWRLFIACCNEAHAHPWACIPHTAGEAYCAAMGKLFADFLDPRLVPKLEYSNEVWNWGWPWGTQSSWVNNQVVAGAGGLRPKYAYFANRAFNWFVGTFPRRVVRVCAGQFGDWSTITYSLDWAATNGVRFDAIAGAPYAMPSVDWPAARALWAAGLKDSAIAPLLRAMNDYLSWIDSTSSTWAGMATKYGVPLLAYEWGPGIIAPQATDAPIMSYLHRSKGMASFIPAMYGVMKKYFTMGCYYSHCRAWGTQPWALREFLDDSTLKADGFAKLVAVNNV